MKNILVLYAFLSLSLMQVGCTDDDSACIKDMIDEFSSFNEDRSFTFILQFDRDGETFTIFDNGIAFDAVATVYDSNCNLVCSYGGFRTNNDQPCDMYQDGINNARQIWPE